jgi:zinc transport system substrate-binding protein
MKTILTNGIASIMGFATVAALALAACGGASSNADVVAAFYPLAYAAQQVGGPGLHVKNLTPPGAEPHDLEVSPRDVTAVESARHVLLLGHGFQPQLERAAGSGASVVRVLDTPGLNRFANGDPHVWLDPLRYQLIVLAIGAKLHHPAAASRLAARLRRLDAAYRRGLRDCARREIVTSHEAFAYLAQRYGLEQIAVTGLSPEAEVKPQDLQRSIDAVRRTHATTVFFETLVSARIANTVARDTGATTAVLNPLEGLTKKQRSRGEDYFSLMRANLAALRKGLGCR